MNNSVGETFALKRWMKGRIFILSHLLLFLLVPPLVGLMLSGKNPIVDLPGLALSLFALAVPIKMYYLPMSLTYSEDGFCYRTWAFEKRTIQWEEVRQVTYKNKYHLRIVALSGKVSIPTSQFSDTERALRSIQRRVAKDAWQISDQEIAQLIAVGNSFR
jgi:hypothetical protein